MSNKILIIDGYNMIHRCRFKWGGGLADDDNQIIYNFFRLLKSTISQFDPDIVYFPLDGKPKARLEADPNYKANRSINTDDQDVLDYWNSFRSQKRYIIDSLMSSYPIRVVHHPDQEGDDLVYYLIKHHHSSDDVTILSSDTDFIQILNEYPDNVKLYNPISKKYRQNTDYDYVSWKSMVGDKADNIPGVKGIGKVGATKILKTSGLLEEKMINKSFKESYTKSYGLIKLMDLGDEEDSIMITSSIFDIDSVEAEFESLSFKTMLTDKYLSSYDEVFSKLKR